jgi:hypothetical protein
MGRVAAPAPSPKPPGGLQKIPLCAEQATALCLDCTHTLLYQRCPISYPATCTAAPYHIPLLVPLPRIISRYLYRCPVSYPATCTAAPYHIPLLAPLPHIITRYLYRCPVSCPTTCTTAPYHIPLLIPLLCIISRYLYRCPVSNSATCTAARAVPSFRLGYSQLCPVSRCLNCTSVVESDTVYPPISGGGRSRS